MAQQRRPIELKFHVTPEEKEIIEKKKAIFIDDMIETFHMSKAEIKKYLK